MWLHPKSIHAPCNLARRNGMNIIVGLAVIVLVGWIVISLLPTLLPIIGYAIVGLIVLVGIGALFGRK
jgi:hypothetical protein